MADYVLYTTENFSRSRRKLPRSLRILIVVLAGMGIGELLYQVTIAPKVLIETVIVRSDSGVSKEEILQLAQIHGPLPYNRVHASEVERRLESVSWIRSAKVEKIFPNRLVIDVAVRRPIGLALVETGSATRLFAFDDELHMFTPRNEAWDTSLPMFSGIRIEGTAEGVQMPYELTRMIRTVMEIRMEEPGVLHCFSEFRILRKEANVYELIAYPLQYKVPVRLGYRFSIETFKSALMVLDVMQKEHILDKVEEIDFRTGNILYRMKGDSVAGG
ncbi:MAG: hypothetical protein Kow009_09930 [Spirochaetales bacterium]